MTISRKPVKGIVKVLRGIPKEFDGDVPATIHDRKGTHRERTHISPEVLDALGDDLFGYFEAERIAGHWYIGKRLPDSPHRRW